jgi:hypothetical protein
MVFYNEEAMSKKRNKQNADPRQMQPQTAPAGGSGRFIAMGLLVLGAGVFLYAVSSETTPTPRASSDNRSASVAVRPEPAAGQSGKYRYFENPEDAHPLPVTLSPSQFPSAVIANTYAIAKEIPEVLAQQPCLCGCDNTSDDHSSLLDCYIDEHASTCMICLKEAVYAKQMTEAGKSGAWIRDAIVRGDFSDVSLGN